MQIQLNKQTIEASAVLFDLDGTLVQSTGGIAEILTAWAEQHGLEVQAVLEFCHGKRTIDIVRHFIQDDAVQQHYTALTEQFLAAAIHTQVIQGAAAFLAQLDQHHVPWAVVSSSERILIEARMKTAGLPLPGLIVSADDIVKGKPDPEGYLKAAQLLNIPIQECIVFEDAPSGIEAAKRAGAQLITVGKMSEDIPWPHIDHYDQLGIL